MHCSQTYIIRECTRTNGYALVHLSTGRVFPDCLYIWDRLSSFIKTSPSTNVFKNKLNQCMAFVITLRVKLLTHLRVGLSHLRSHTFSHNFQDTKHPTCSCTSKDIETVEHCLLNCPNYSTTR